ncbi:MAG TPA: glycosyltransferase family 2 protein [Candidatus Anoxymicrobiaceae bacterium]
MGNIRLKIRKPVSLERVEGGLRVKGGYTRWADAQRPLVSVITVCLNSEKYLEGTIESVFGQSYTDIEYIIVDGGSTDGTLDIIRKYEDHLSYWVSEPDEGIYDAMNKGISLATGDLVGIINSDDYYLPDAVQEVVSASREDPEAQVFFGSMHIMDEDNGLQGIWEVSWWDTKKLSINHPACFVRRPVYDNYLYRTKYRLSADCDLMLRLELEGIRFHCLDRPLACFRTGGASSASYYRLRADHYRIKQEHGILSVWRYIYKRLALIFKVPRHWLRETIARRYFKEIDELRAAYGDLLAQSIATKNAMEVASAHITKLEREIDKKNAYIEDLEERVMGAGSAGQLESIAPGPRAFGKLAYYIRTEGLLSALRRARHHFIGKGSGRTRPSD